jgi:hypothetical protein
MQNQRRLSGAAHCNPAYADDGSREPSLLCELSSPVEACECHPNCRERSQEYRRGRQPTRQCIRREFEQGTGGTYSGTSFRFGQFPGSASEHVASPGVLEQIVNGRRKFASIVDPDGCTRVSELLSDAGEVLHVRPNNDRAAEERRFEDVVSSSARECAPHKNGIGDSE